MFETFLIQPLYNGFIALVGVMPGGDVGLAIIGMTLLVRLVFYPAFAASIRTQMGMQAVQGEIDEINTKYKENPKERAERTMALFKEKNIRPFASLLAILIQLPIFIALYFVFFREGLPDVNTELLYSFVTAPEHMQTVFLGFLNLLEPHNIALALLASVSQFAVAWLSLSRARPSASQTSQQAAAHKVQRMMILYFLPSFIGVLTYTFPAGVGLYFIAGNLFSLGQELIIKRQLAAKNA